MSDTPPLGLLSRRLLARLLISKTKLDPLNRLPYGMAIHPFVAPVIVA